MANLASVIKQGIESHVKELHTSIPGIIETFDPEKQLASIQPAVKRIFITRDGETEILAPSELPILINVPVIFPRGGGFSLTFPVKKGDECLIMFCERSIDNWHKTGKVEVPGARRFHSLSDATAIVGLSSLVNKVPNYSSTDVQIKADDNSTFISLNEDKTMDIHANEDINATCNNMNVTANNNIVANCKNIKVTATTEADLTAPTIKLNGNTTIDGTLDVTGVTTAPTVAATSSLTVAGTEMKDHKHAGSPTAPSGAVSDTGTPI